MFRCSFLLIGFARLIHCFDLQEALQADGFSVVREAAAKIRQDIVKWRRELHRTPEVMYQEHKTSQLIQRALQELGISFTTGWSKNIRQDRIPGPGGTGVVAEIGSGKPPIVALRTDIDALPILEETPVPFRSENPGRMHACGHDGHASMLLGAGKLLQQSAHNLAGTVRLIFQPAEEGGAGAKRMVEEGVLDNVTRIFGMHLWPALPTGSIGGRAGTLMAAGDFFEFRIEGKGAHGAMPHQGIDPITAAAAVIQSLQTVVSREVDPQESAVVSVTKVLAGDAFNVIPAAATIGGTIRAMTTEGLDLLRKRILEITQSVAAAHRCTVSDAKFMPDPFSPTVNDEMLWQWIASPEGGIFGSTKGPKMHWNINPTMGGEDFSFFAEKVPGAFIFLGQGSGSDKFEIGANTEHFHTNVSLHSPRFNMDESALDLGAALHTHLALRSLQSLSSPARAEL